MLATIGALAFLLACAGLFLCLGAWSEPKAIAPPINWPSELDQSDRIWLRWHFTLAGQKFSLMQCKHSGPDVIESGGMLLCPECREAVHDQTPLLPGVSTAEALEVAERVRVALAHQNHRKHNSIVISCPGCRADNA